MSIKNEVFDGIAPRIDKRLLKEHQAQVAENCVLLSGALVPLKEAGDVVTTVPANTGTIAKYNDTWFAEEGKVSIVQSPVSADQFNRVYFNDKDGNAFVQGRNADVGIVVEDLDVPNYAGISGEYKLDGTQDGRNKYTLEGDGTTSTSGVLYDGVDDYYYSTNFSALGSATERTIALRLSLQNTDTNQVILSHINSSNNDGWNLFASKGDLFFQHANLLSEMVIPSYEVDRVYSIVIASNSVGFRLSVDGGGFTSTYTHTYTSPTTTPNDFGIGCRGGGLKDMFGEFSLYELEIFNAYATSPSWRYGTATSLGLTSGNLILGFSGGDPTVNTQGVELTANGTPTPIVSSGDKQIVFDSVNEQWSIKWGGVVVVQSASWDNVATPNLVTEWFDLGFSAEVDVRAGLSEAVEGDFSANSTVYPLEVKAPDSPPSVTTTVNEELPWRRVWHAQWEDSTKGAVDKSDLTEGEGTLVEGTLYNGVLDGHYVFSGTMSNSQPVYGFKTGDSSTQKIHYNSTHSLWEITNGSYAVLADSNGSPNVPANATWGVENGFMSSTLKALGTVDDDSGNTTDASFAFDSNPTTVAQRSIPASTVATMAVGIEWTSRDIAIVGMDIKGHDSAGFQLLGDFDLVTIELKGYDGASWTTIAMRDDASVKTIDYVSLLNSSETVTYDKYRIEITTVTNLSPNELYIGDIKFVLATTATVTGDAVVPQSQVQEVVAGREYYLHNPPNKSVAGADAQFVMWMEYILTQDDGDEQNLFNLYPRPSMYSKTELEENGYNISANIEASGNDDPATFKISYYPNTADADRIYTCSYVTSWGEESGLTEGATMLGVGAYESVNIEFKDSVPSDREYIKRRLYRSTVGTATQTYRLVKELDISVLTYTDDVEQKLLGAMATTLDGSPPPDSLSGIAVHPRGFLLGFHGRDMYFSEPYLPHLWRNDLTMTMEYEVFSFRTTEDLVVILTSGGSYLLSGSTPDDIIVSDVNVRQGGVNSSSIVDAGVAIVYASNDGLVSVRGTDHATVITGKFFDRRDWQSLSPSSMEMGVYDGRVLCSFDVKSSEAQRIVGAGTTECNGVYERFMSDSPYFLGGDTSSEYRIILEEVSNQLCLVKGDYDWLATVPMGDIYYILNSSTIDSGGTWSTLVGDAPIPTQETVRRVLILNLEENMEHITTWGNDVDAFFVDKEDDALYFLEGTSVYKFEGGSDNLPVRWHGREFRFPHDVDFCVGKVMSEGHGTVTLTIFNKTEVVYSRKITSDKEFKLPVLRKGTVFSILIETEEEVYVAGISDTLGDI